MIVDVPTVQLKNEFAVLHDLLVLVVAVATWATQQLLVPSTTAFDIPHRDEGLSFHDALLLHYRPPWYDAVINQILCERYHHLSQSL